MIAGTGGIRMPALKATALFIGAAVALTARGRLPFDVTAAPAASAVDMVTYHNDTARTGQNLNEIDLTPASVSVSTFAKIGFFGVDGRVDAQPLYLSGVAIPGQGTHSVLYVASEHDTLYAFDADTGVVLWRVSLLGSGESPSDDRGCGQVTPEIGITSTPVIDRTAGPSGAIYVVAMSKNGSGSYYQRLHALSVTTGAELFGGPRDVVASFPGSGAGGDGTTVMFDPRQYKERASLLLVNGKVITTWASHCDIPQYTGWIIAYSASTLAQTSVLNVIPNGSEGAMWMSGAGPAADPAGNVYLLDGNGTFDTTIDGRGFPSRGDFGNAFLKLSTSTGLAVADYFATWDTVQQSNQDLDLGSGGAMVLPDQTDSLGRVRHLTVGAGKDAHIYVADRDSMGKWNSTTSDNRNIYQDIAGALGGGVFSMPAYFSNTVYFGAVGDAIKAFSIASARLSSTPSSATTRAFGYPGATPGISANGNASGILWAVENTDPAVLHAYDALNLSRELYNSNQAAGGRDHFGPGNKFITPTIANGRVYVGTTNGVAAFGLLAPPGPATLVSPSGTVSSTPSFTWNAVSAATWYDLWVQPGGGAPLLQQWYESSTVCGASTCTVSPAIALAGSTAYTWWVQTYNGNGYGPWSSGMTFTTIALPPAPTLTGPTGASASPQPAYTWNAASGATSYYLWVQAGGASPAIQTIYNASSVCGGSVCAVTPSTELPDGTYSWWVAALNGIGGSPWSSGMTFTVNVGMPAVATLIYPFAGSEGMRAPVFRFNRVPAATWYYLWVQPADGSPIIQTWYMSPSICGATTCTAAPGVTLTAGASYNWWIQTYNVRSFGGWSAPTLFTEATSSPGTADVTGPTGTVPAMPTYTWTRVPGASYYYLWVQVVMGAPVVQTWVRADQVCGASGCAFTPATGLASGASFNVWVQTWNDAGYGPWSAPLGFVR
jgi:hypothetical protein